MKVIGVEYGRVSLLVDLLELGTRTGIYLPEAALFVQGRYAFVHAPSVPTQDKAQPMYRFEQGRLDTGKAQYSISAFEIHPHGLVVQGTDTDAAEAFFEDFFVFGAEHLHIKKPEREPTKIFLSAMVVEFAEDANKFLSKWKEISKVFSGQLESNYGIKESAQLSRVALQADPQSVAPRLAALVNEFTIERRIYEPFSHQRFFTSAPLRTDDHIVLLQKIEQIAL
jgi:hypothetical protein